MWPCEIEPTDDRQAPGLTDKPSGCLRSLAIPREIAEWSDPNPPGARTAIEGPNPHANDVDYLRHNLDENDNREGS